jgi:hypothetical protein
MLTISAVKLKLKWRANLYFNFTLNDRFWQFNVKLLKASKFTILDLAES